MGRVDAALADPAAFAAGTLYLLASNVRDFAGSERFGVEAIRAGPFLQRLGATR